jgi:uncharacterized membrane protein YeaQ/YmgE (transglycosylase-associated protein family)
MTWVGLIIAGAIIGALARLFLPGAQPIGVLLTVLTGIVGTLIGWWLAGAIGVAQTGGVDWIRWVISIVVAAVLVSIVAALRRGSARP